MIATTNEWEELLETDDLLPESNVNIVCNDTVEDTSTWNVSSENCEEMSNINILASKPDNINWNEDKIATFEHNFWILDGTFEVADETTKVDRYMSDILCDENGDFPEDNYPQVTLTPNNPPFLEPYVYTLKFAPFLNECAKNVVLSGSTSNELIIEEYDEEYVYVDNLYPRNAGSSILTIKSWSMPFRRARVSEFLIGARLFFDKNNLSSFSHERTTDMVDAELPQNDCKYKVLDINNDYDINNPTARFIHDLDTSSVFQIYYGYKINQKWEYHLIDTVNLASVERPQNGIEATFTLESDLSQKTQTFLDTVSDNSNNEWTSYSSLLQKIANKTGITITRNGGNYATNTFSNMYRTSRTIDEDYYKREMREWLQLVAAAINSFLRRNPNGSIDTICLVDSNGSIKSANYVDTISLDNCFKYPEIENIDVIKNVVLTILKTHNSSSSPDKFVTIDIPNIGNVHIPPYRYSKNYNTIGVDQTAENKAIIITYNNNNAGFKTTDGIHTTYMNWLNTFISGASRIKANCRINPAWQVGDLIRIQLRNGNYVKGYITDIAIEYSGYPKGNVTILAPKSINKEE